MCDESTRSPGRSGGWRCTIILERCAITSIHAGRVLATLRLGERERQGTPWALEGERRTVRHSKGLLIWYYINKKAWLSLRQLAVKSSRLYFSLSRPPFLIRTAITLFAQASINLLIHNRFSHLRSTLTSYYSSSLENHKTERREREKKGKLAGKGGRKREWREERERLRERENRQIDR